MNTQISATSRCVGAAIAALLLTTGTAFAKGPHKRIEFDNSYLIHKLEGAAGITGAQMPFGGPALSQATIDQIRAWISSGALNN